VLTPEQIAQRLAETVKQEQDVSVQLGKTNGRPCLHIMKDRQSYTIYEEHEWDHHLWNGSAARARKEANAETLEAIANKAAQ